jgi:Cd2+/Zn2+-exporting ATPase
VSAPGAGAIALGDYVEGASIVVLFTVAEWLEDKCVSRARSALSEVMALQPDTARLASSGAEVPVSSVAVDQEVLVRPGDKVPLDGVVVAGTTTLDESTLTGMLDVLCSPCAGFVVRECNSAAFRAASLHVRSARHWHQHCCPGETRPVRKVPGDSVMAGTLNNGTASLRVVVTADASSSTVATLRNLVEKALVDKSRTERFVEVFARYYTPVVLLTALLLALVPSLLSRSDWRQWTYLALVVLVTAW